MLIIGFVVLAFLYFVISERKTEYPDGTTWGWKTSILANVTAFGFIGVVIGSLLILSEVLFGGF